ncbi:carbohydrate ABC transporter permease [Bradyrhizobium sp. STM 3809]|uniref:carbohydrate ABC transporter permease n=1 Tax=Bradyrhizobium sp. STM 3809 TaxID=551936 RepID=UPI00024086CD|nr:carbohydrate ABC transporter permease [Bradyrhizobium sp. STM 3809]CCD97893.1 Binding-protein-dependent transport systems inner membrane component [Bradyrhizobium sp. STM 3809]
MRSLGRIILFVIVGAFVLVPLAQTFMTSFVSTLPRAGIAEGHFSLVNYQTIFQSPVLKQAILNSIIYVALNVVLCLAVGLPAAYAFARYHFVGDRQLFFLLLVFRITPTVVLSLPIFVLFAQIGLENSPVGIALVHCVFNIPISIWILEGFIASVPREFDEMAFLDGHSLPSFFVRHLIPAIAPGIGVTAFFCFMFSWVEVVLARILTTTGGKPITMAINALFGFRTDFGLVMAMTVLALVPGIAMIYFVRNHLARGFVIRT